MLLLFDCNHVDYIKMGFLFLLVHVIDCAVLLWHSLFLSYSNYYVEVTRIETF